MIAPDLVVFLRFLNDGPPLCEIINAFEHQDKARIRTQLKKLEGCADGYIEGKYQFVIVKFWSYLDENNKARFWKFIKEWTAQREEHVVDGVAFMTRPIKKPRRDTIRTDALFFGHEKQTTLF